MWKPKRMGKQPLKKPSPIYASLLKVAINKLSSRMCNITIKYKLQDEHGVFGYLTNFWVVVAKRYVYGQIVSCHKRALYSAINNKKLLLMYIEKTNAFYEFRPEDIINCGQYNMRGNVEMVNFPITLGRRIDENCEVKYGERFSDKARRHRQIKDSNIQEFIGGRSNNNRNEHRNNC